MHTRTRLTASEPQAKRDYENFYMGPPFRVSDYYGRHLLTQQQWILAEKLAEVSSKPSSGCATSWSVDIVLMQQSQSRRLRRTPRACFRRRTPACSSLAICPGM